MLIEGQDTLISRKSVAIFSGQGGIFVPDKPFNVRAQQELFERQSTEHSNFRRLIEGSGYNFDFVYGHSVGEIEAAAATGVLDAVDAKLIATTRDRLFNFNPRGAMAVVRMPIEQLIKRIEGTQTQVAIFYDGNNNVVSGEVEEIHELVKEFGHKVRRLDIPRAAHHPFAQPVQDEMTGLINSINFSDPSIPMIGRIGQIMIKGEEVRQELIEAHTQPVFVNKVVDTFKEFGIQEGWEFGGNTVLIMITKMDGSFNLKSISEFNYEALLQSTHQ